MKKGIFSIVGLLMLSLTFSQVQAARHHNAEDHTKQARAAAVVQQAKSIDINTADAQTLAALKGIGVKKSQAIVEYREQHGRFASVEDLTKVHGVGPKLLARIQRMNLQKLVVNPAP